jgi:hypothetical protein
MNNKVICRECESSLDSEVEDDVLIVEPCAICIDAKAAEWTEGAYNVKPLVWVSNEGRIRLAATAEHVYFFTIEAETMNGVDMFRLKSAPYGDCSDTREQCLYATEEEAQAAAARIWANYLELTILDSVKAGVE